MEQQPDLIDLLGGTGSVATALRQKDSTVSNWKSRGIPWRWRPRIAALAKQKKIAIPAGFLSPTEVAA